MPYKIIIVDDESAARLRMQQLLANYPANFDIIGEAHNGLTAISKIEKLRPFAGIYGG